MPGRPAAADCGRPAPTTPRPGSRSGHRQSGPQYDPESRPGDNLYTNAVVALDIDTGKLVWHFQYTPNDSWDYDEIGIHMLYDETINGEKRKVVSHFARNGFFYSIDRGNGKLHQGQPIHQRAELDQGA